MVESTAYYRTFVSDISSDMAYGQPIPVSLQYMMSAVQPEQLAEQYELMYEHAVAALKDAADHVTASELQAMHLRHEVEALERERRKEEGGRRRRRPPEQQSEECN